MDTLPEQTESAVRDPISDGRLRRYLGFTTPYNCHRQSPDELSVLYFITSGDLVKIGIAQDLERRLREIRLGNPHPLKVKSRGIPRSIARQIEREVHALLAHAAVGREWFTVSAEQAIEVAKPVIARAHRAVHQMNIAGVF